jgi:hypothetical protein
MMRKIIGYTLAGVLCLFTIILPIMTLALLILVIPFIFVCEICKVVKVLPNEFLSSCNQMYINHTRLIASAVKYANKKNS